MNICLVCIFFPYIIIHIYIDLLDSIQCYHIKIPYRLIVLRRIACRHNDPACWNLLISKGFILQKLQHRRCQSLRHAVDLINEQNSFSKSCLFHLVIYRSDDLTHRIFCNRVLFPIVRLLFNKRKSDRTLSGMMCDRIRYQCDFTLLCHLFHNLCLTDSRRPHQENWSLSY